MKNKIYTLIAAVCLTANVWAQVGPPTYQWAKTISPNSSTDKAYCTGVVSDAAGNVYTTGYIPAGTVTFSGGPSFTVPGGHGYFFISKYNAAGVYQWAYCMGNASFGSIEASDIKIDNASNIYICGGVGAPSVNFNPTGTGSPTSFSGNSGFVAKYDQNANLMWVAPFSGAGSVTSIDLDNSGNLFAATDTPTPGGFGLVKLSCSTGSQLASTAAGCGSSGTCGGSWTKLRVDASGNVFAAVNFWRTLQTTGSFTLTCSSASTSGLNYAIIKYSNNLAYSWSAQIGGSLSSNIPQGDWNGDNYTLDIAIDNSGNPCVVGSFGGTTQFAPTTSLTVAGNSSTADGFFAKYNNSTGALTYVKQIRSTSGYTTKPFKVQIDANDYINITGDFAGITNFNPAGTATLSACGNNPALFLAKYDGSGNYVSAYDIYDHTCTSSTEPYSVFLSGSNLYLCGGLSTSQLGGTTNTQNFDMGGGTANILPFYYGPYAFFAKYNYCSLAPAQPTAISGATTLCNTAVTTYSVAAVSGAASYTWSLPGGWSGTSTTNTISVTAGATSGTISVGAVNACGTSTVQTLPVTVNGSPTVTVNSGAICSGSSFTMSPSGANTYTFSSGSAVVTPTTNTTYSVTGTSTAGCVSSNTAVSTVTVNPLPTITVNSGTICNGQSFTMTPSGANTYTYSGGSAIVNPTTTSSYSVTGTSAAGCLSSNTAVSTVTVNNAPAQPTSISGNNFICTGTVNSYSVASVAGATSYAWSLPNVWSGSSTTNSINATAGTSGSLSVTANNSCGNSPAQIINLTVLALPTVTAGAAPDSVCSGNSTTLTAGGANTYLWNNGNSNTSQSVSPTVNTTYTVTGTDVNNCVNTATVSVKVNQLPTLTYNQNPNSVCINHAPFTLSTGFPTGGTYSGLGVTGNSFNPATAGTGTITITYSYTDTYGCTNTKTQNIVVNACTDINQLAGNQNQVAIYPNPFTDELTIESPVTTKGMLYNMLGEKINEFNLEKKSQTINLSDLAPGIYYLQIMNRQIKIVKQ
ncbi:MAG TPA: T9SS type A sorting domain-containing protein [Bacteroidia bacterium]|jgi:hypothetical protein|nr:T9SS type A sorting domain-containing protein [Bacteroidia bacterium]